MSFGPVYANRILGFTVLGSPVTPIQTAYLGLCTSIGSLGLSYAEPSAGRGYARIPVIFGSPVNRRVTNITSHAFAAATSPWDPIPHVALFDDPTAGDMIVFGTMPSTKTVATSVVVALSVNSLTYAID